MYLAEYLMVAHLKTGACQTRRKKTNLPFVEIKADAAL